MNKTVLATTMIIMDGLITIALAILGSYLILSGHSTDGGWTLFVSFVSAINPVSINTKD